ncbi:SDR family NAD(P)-dependent oxidoreductase [Streptomyces tauricus]|uniref:SDR family NAD(P)-dependent oxidoreductase n=1 Tax=Streptomyces tauricus TaxID=68274 RepID=A0ABZ1JPD0_9ACTN|nr:SDR family NAD(P)-dependent oxidoreductase [Streptomyces tauricus]
MEAKTIVITGASDGIGAEAARQLHHHGHQVVVVGRSASKTNAVGDELGVDRHIADFSRLADVRRLAADLRAARPRIDVLANNAGGIFGDRTKTGDGFDLTFQVNHLAPFLLTHLLLDVLTTSGASVIQTSSAGARLFGNVALDDLEHDRDFTPQRAYGTAKLDNILFTQELHRRFHDRGISAAAFHPGTVASNFASSSGNFVQRVYGSRLTRLLMSTPQKAAGQLVWLAEGRPGTDWESGVYYERRKPAKRIHPQTRDSNVARQLWDESMHLLKLPRG